jgi:hypothetical protein
MSYKIKVGRRGFSLIYNNHETKWDIRIDSMVPRAKRTKLEHYYILLFENDKPYDRYYIEEGEVKCVKCSDVPKYVSEIIHDILISGDINKYSEAHIDNQFTRIAKRDSEENGR